LYCFWASTAAIHLAKTELLHTCIHSCSQQKQQLLHLNMRSLLRARRLLFNSVHARSLHTENEIYKPAKDGTIPTMVGELICAMIEGKQLPQYRSL
jgi:hypothetical protein